MIGNICSKTSGENLLKELGKLVKNPLENLGEKQCPNPQIYRDRKTSHWGQSGMSVDRPVDRPTVIFQTVGRSAGRSTDRPTDLQRLVFLAL